MDKNQTPPVITAPYFKTTDVQRTWKRAGWEPPSENPDVWHKWNYFRTLDTENRRQP